MPSSRTRPAVARRRLPLPGRLVALAAGGALGGLALVPAGAVAAPDVRILAPSDGATIEGETLVVRVRANVPQFSAVLDGRDVSRRFGAVRGGVRTASFTRGRDFATGRGSILVAAGRRGTPARRGASASFTALRRDDRLLRIARSPRGVARAALHVHARSAKPVREAQVWLNGRRVEDQLRRHRDGRGLQGTLGADDRLRFGANRVVVRTVHDDWTVARSARTFRVSRDAPLVGAGAGREGVVRRPVTLDGSSTRAARRGDRLRYRWQLVAAPRGSKARLRNATGVRARIVPDRPGTYRARLTVVAADEGDRASVRGATAAAQQAPTPGATAAQAPAPRASAAQTQPLTPLQPPSSRSTPLVPPPPAPPSRSLPLSAPVPLPLVPEASVPLRAPAPFPLEQLPLAAVDEVALNVDATDDPMGLPIQTITSAGGIQIGAKPYPRAGGWVRMLQISPDNGQGIGSQSFEANDGAGLLRAIRAAPTNVLIVLSGQGDDVTGKLDDKSLATAFGRLGGTVGTSGPTPDGAKDLAVGQWSLIGVKGAPAGSAHQSFAAGQAPIPGFLGGSAGQPGTLNGYLQSVTTVGYQFVSPENVSIDTSATGSSATQNVIEIGGARYASGGIAQGALGAQLLVLDPTVLQPLDQGTFALTNPDGSAVRNASGAQGLAARLSYWRGVETRVTTPPLIVLQTFGATAPGVSPNGSAYWTNDALPSMAHNTSWYNGSFPGAGSTKALDAMWNPGYPTVAGQVGLLAGTAYHHVVANYGFGNRNKGGITVVAATRLWDPGAAFAQGQTDPVPSSARLVGTLTRNRQSQWAVRAPALTDGWSSSTQPADKMTLDAGVLWETAFAAPTAWPQSGTARLAAASRWVAAELWCQGDPINCDVQDVRDAYVSKESDFVGDDANVLLTALGEVQMPPPSMGFDRDDLTALVRQLRTEFRYVIQVRSGISTWQGLFNATAGSTYVNFGSIGGDLIADVLKAQQTKEEVELDAQATASDSLLVLSALVDLAGPETLDFAPAALDGISAGLELAGDLTPPSPSSAAPGQPDEIRTKVSDLQGAMKERYSGMSSTLDHLGDVFVADWGKLQTMGPRFNDQWAFGSRERKAAVQTMTIGAERSFYEAIMPIAYQQWVVSPRFTSDNGLGPIVPVSTYQCRWVTSDDNGGWEFSGHDDPFKNRPAGSTHEIFYRPASGPDATAKPAQTNTAPITGRGLRSSVDKMNLQSVGTGEDNVPVLGVRHVGSGPPSQHIDPLFNPVSATDSPTAPSALGMTKDEFYGADGWTLRKMQCGANQG